MGHTETHIGTVTSAAEVVEAAFVHGPVWGLPGPSATAFRVHGLTLCRTTVQRPGSAPISVGHTPGGDPTVVVSPCPRQPACL